jgi:hypothetical protein
MRDLLLTNGFAIPRGMGDDDGRRAARGSEALFACELP